MRASYKLLRQLIDFDWSPEELAEKFTMSGSEVEGIIYPRRWISDIVVAEVREVRKDTPRPGLSECVVFDGKREYITLSGAPNIKPGIKVAFVRPGGKIFGEKQIGILEIEGHKSEGMMCSGVEVGVGFPKDELLPVPEDTPPGEDLIDLLNWRDEAIFEMEITPNRPDCYGHWGLAREIAALKGTPWEPTIPRPQRTVEDTGGVEVEIQTPHCPRYTGRLVEGVKVKPSPLYLQGLLAALGMRPINNIVDITNYVMMLTGQPIHAFDERKLGRKIIVRMANPGEKFITLDGVERELSPEIMMIATPEKPVAVAGIMGGENSEVDETTTDIVIEVAYFNPSTVRRGKKLLELTTESAIRFERGTDPNIPPAVSDIIAAMTEQLADAEKVYRIVDVYPNPIEPAKVTLTDEKVERLLGKKIPRQTSRQILVCLGLDIVSENAGGVTYLVPTFRPDLVREVDLIEEVGRIYGLNNIEPSSRAQGEIPAELGEEVKLRHYLEDIISGMGFRYAMTDPLGNEKLFSKFATRPLVKIKNPLSDDLAVMRPNPLPGLVGAVARNLNRGHRTVRLFEIDFGYWQENDEYHERMYIVLAGGGKRFPISWNLPDEPLDFFDIKGATESLLEKFGITASFEPSGAKFAEENLFLTITDAATGEKIGFVGTLAKSLWDFYELRQDVHFALLEFDALKPYFAATPKYRAFSRFPGVRRDVALIMDRQIPAQKVLDAARKIAADAEKIGLFDVYSGKPIPPDKKSLGLFFIFRAPDRTLTDEEVNEKFNRIVSQLCAEFDATVREQ